MITCSEFRHDCSRPIAFTSESWLLIILDDYSLNAIHQIADSLHLYMMSSRHEYRSNSHLRCYFRTIVTIDIIDLTKELIGRTDEKISTILRVKRI